MEMRANTVVSGALIGILSGALFVSTVALASEEPPAEVEEAGSDRPAPWLMVREGLGMGYGPLGLVSDTRVQARMALHRSDSIVFQNTYAGIGGKARVSPAFVDGGLLLSFAPIDVFDLDLAAEMTGTWAGSSGQLFYSVASGKTGEERAERTDRQMPGYRLTLSASPTLKIKVGPIIALNSVEIAYLHHLDPQPEETTYVYEALRDMVVAWDDVVITQFGALLYENKQGELGSVFRAGAVVRDRMVLKSGDGHTAVGGILMFRKAQVPKSPALVLLGFAYVRDADRVGGANIQGQLIWSLERPLKP